MENPILAKRKLVQDRIAKSFDSGINLAEEMSLEKAWNVGDEKQYLGVTYYVGGFNAKGQPLWRKKKDGSVGDKKSGASQTQSSTSDLASKINANIDSVLKVAGVDSYSNVVDVKATDSSVIIKYNDVGGHLHTLPLTKSVAQSVLKEVDKQKRNTPAPRKPGSTDEIERMTAQGVRSSILGLNNIATNVKDNGDHFKIDFDANDFNTNGKRSPQIDRIAKFLESMGASCVIGSNSIKAYKKVEAKKYSDMDIKDAKKVLVGKVVTLKDYWPDGRGGSQDAVGEIKNVRLYGKDKLHIAEISYPNGDEQMIRLDEIDDGKMKDSYKTPIVVGDDKTHLDAVRKKIANINSDPRDKIAQDAGFKDYSEMKGYQDYVTQKNLLKKKSTKSGLRLLYEREVAQYEKDNADLIKRMSAIKAKN